LILREDEYRRIPEASQVWPGDIVAYRDQDADEILHVGRVYRVIQGTVPGLANARVISKWSDCAGEYLHDYQDVPYPKMGFSITIEFYTDRPPME
jgi:hypothetical protein